MTHEFKPAEFNFAGTKFCVHNRPFCKNALHATSRSKFTFSDEFIRSRVLLWDATDPLYKPYFKATLFYPGVNISFATVKIFDLWISSNPGLSLPNF